MRSETVKIYCLLSWIRIEFQFPLMGQWFIVLRSCFNSLTEATGNLTIENNIVSSEKNLILDLIFSSRLHYIILNID